MRIYPPIIIQENKPVYLNFAACVNLLASPLFIRLSCDQNVKGIQAIITTPSRISSVAAIELNITQYYAHRLKPQRRCHHESIPRAWQCTVARSACCSASGLPVTVVSVWSLNRLPCCLSCLNSPRKTQQPMEPLQSRSSFFHTMKKKKKPSRGWGKKVASKLSHAHSPEQFSAAWMPHQFLFC